MSDNADYNRLIMCQKWRKLRRDVLSAHPLCIECERQGRVTLATEVHHITPIESVQGYEAKKMLAYSPANLVPLCHACHVEAHTTIGRGKQANRQRVERQLKEYSKLWLEGDDTPGGVF